LLEAIRQKLGMGERVENRFTVARRVVDRIATVDGELQQLNKALQKSIEYELVAETLREIHQLLALTLADDEPTESLLDSIFTRFCIGK
jgi:tRNA U34 5-carboxymethylaminomethyl modifying GTPase MnmE/TrmE